MSNEAEKNKDIENLDEEIDNITSFISPAASVATYYKNRVSEIYGEDEDLESDDSKDMFSDDESEETFEDDGEEKSDSDEKNNIALDSLPKITVLGVGGAGCNAVNNMIEAKLQGVEFVVANTDVQSLLNAKTKKHIQLGQTITKGLGAGAKPEVGEASAEESIEDILGIIKKSNMLFITAGMGGGTGTGAAPVIARLAKEQGILTVAVVTKPFNFEGKKRKELSDEGIRKLAPHVDTLIVIPNQNLFKIADVNTSFVEAFRMADSVLYSGVSSITDLMVKPGLINLDFADVKTVMQEMGKAMMGSGKASGENRAMEAAEAAISNPLLDNSSMKGADGVLINITGGNDMTLAEVDEAANRIRQEVDEDCNIIFGACYDEGLKGIMRVSVVATGIGDDFSSDTNRSYNFKNDSFIKKDEKPEKILSNPVANSDPFADMVSSFEEKDSNDFYDSMDEETEDEETEEYDYSTGSDNNYNDETLEVEKQYQKKTYDYRENYREEKNTQTRDSDYGHNKVREEKEESKNNYNEYNKLNKFFDNTDDIVEEEDYYQEEVEEEISVNQQRPEKNNIQEQRQPNAQQQDSKFTSKFNFLKKEKAKENKQTDLISMLKKLEEIPTFLREDENQDD